MATRVLETVIPREKCKQFVERLRKNGWSTMHPTESIKVRDPNDYHGQRAPVPRSELPKHIIVIAYQ